MDILRFCFYPAPDAGVRDVALLNFDLARDAEEGESRTCQDEKKVHSLQREKKLENVTSYC